MAYGVVSRYQANERSGVKKKRRATIIQANNNIGIISSAA